MNVGDLGKLIVAEGFKILPKVQWIAQSGHTDSEPNWKENWFFILPLKRPILKVLLWSSSN